jgi:hypothetical protein
MCNAQLYSMAETRYHPPPLPSPRIWAHIRGRYWSAKIKTTSLCNPLVITENVVAGREERKKIGIRRDRQIRDKRIERRYTL